MRVRSAKHRTERWRQQRSIKTTSRLSRKDLQRKNQQLERELEKLRRQLAERDERIAEAERQRAETEKQIAEAEKKIADLEGRLAMRLQNSTTSSKPPSSDGLAGSPRQRGRKSKSRRKPGGQPGHAGRNRPLVPADRVDTIVKLYPEQCGGCGRKLPKTGKGLELDGEPRRHQVTEIPEIRAHITEYQCHKAVCPDCGKATGAPLPEDVQDGFGPQLTGWIVYMTVVCRMPRRIVQRFLEEALHIDISLGSTQKAWEQASAAVEIPYEQLREDLKNQPVVNGDETGHRTNAEKRWLWVMVARTYVVYMIAASRKAEVLVALLGKVFNGILCSDRCPSYAKYHQGKLQYCWAHFKRNILGALELAKTSEAERFCRDALALHARLFRLWHRFRGNTDGRAALMTRLQLRQLSMPIEKKFFALAERHLDSADSQIHNLAHALLVNFENFFTFIDSEGVEPTNNSAERALRHAVIWRKIMFGNRSEAGEVAVARLLSIAATCKIQQRDALAYITSAIRCHRRGETPPSLFSK
jgi:transposase